jgi:hypothetical protein
MTLNNSLPFENPVAHDKYYDHYVLKKKYKSYISASLNELLIECFQFNPDKRITLEHIYFSRWMMEETLSDEEYIKAFNYV